jgi:hypothetical protein
VLSRSDFVLWHEAGMPAGAVRRSAFGALRLLAWRQVGTTSPAFDPELSSYGRQR